MGESWLLEVKVQARRFTRRALAGVVLALATGCAQTSEPTALPERVTPSATPTQRATTSPTPTPTAPISAKPDVKITRCADVQLPDEGVGEADFWVDSEGGLLGIYFSDNRNGEYVNVAYTVRYAEDRSCHRSPEVAELIGRVDPPGWLPPAADCEVLGPRKLPSGTAPGRVVHESNAKLASFLHTWGTGVDRVSIGRGWEVLAHSGIESPRFPRTGGERVVGQDGVRRWVMAIGDPSAGADHVYVRPEGMPLRPLGLVRHDVGRRDVLCLPTRDSSGGREGQLTL